MTDRAEYEERLREAFEREQLPEFLAEAAEKYREELEGELEALLEEAEAKLRDEFEAELSDALDKDEDEQDEVKIDEHAY
jgi:hypothetical protein